jgi:predicted  nucleic acid-binding Zn-ribbon protein
MPNHLRLSESDCIPVSLLLASASISAFTLPHFAVTSRQLIFAAIGLLSLSAVFALLNLEKTRGLKTEAIQSEGARISAEQIRVSREKQLKEREAAVAAANAKFDDTQNKIAASEADLAKVQAEKTDLEAKLRANETEIADLRTRIGGAETKTIAGNSPSASTADLQAQLDDAKKQLDAAEREKILLSDKMKVTQEKSTQLETERRRRPANAANSSGIRGTVLAVNQAYNFVVLSLGARQGVEPNSEMLVLRGGSFIGKIRISSVEPATAIGDIISNTLARGVQVQPGDTVVYGGNNS